MKHGAWTTKCISESKDYDCDSVALGGSTGDDDTYVDRTQFDISRFWGMQHGSLWATSARVAFGVGTLPEIDPGILKAKRLKFETEGVPKGL